MEGELALLGKYIGAGLAAFGLAGAGLGVGNIAGKFLEGALRNPSAAASQLMAKRRSRSARSTATASRMRGPRAGPAPNGRGSN